jgi:apolipoprotein N-acyltransferase
MGTSAAAGTIGPTVYACARLFFELGPVASALMVLAVSQLFAGFPIAFCAYLSGDPLRSSAAVATLRFAAAWVAQELLRAVALTGLPWAFLAHALAPVPSLIQAASLGGAFLVSFWLAAVNAAFGLACLPARRRGALAVVVGATACIAAAHAASLLLAPEPSGPPLRARLVQGNLPERWRGDAGSATRSLTVLADLTEDEGARVDLAVWPENAVSFLLPVNDLPLERATRRLSGTASYVLLGAPRVAGDRPAHFRNAAFLVDPGRGILSFHDKVHLVPFAEYVPWPAAMLGMRGPRYEAGARPTVLDAGGTLIGPLVCYEVIFPEISRALVRDGAEVLVNVSNDYWLGGPAGSEQHLAAAVFRAVELGRPLLRSTNTGVTAAIDARGRTLARLPRDRADAVTVDFQPARGRTLTARTGNAFAWLASAGAIAGALAERRRRTRSA